MIKPFCDMCGLDLDDLDDFGGLIFSPPMGNDVVIKQHICKDCYTKNIVPLLKASNVYSKDIWVRLDKATESNLKKLLTES